MFDLPRLREADSGVEDDSNNNSAQSTIHRDSSMDDINTITTDDTFKEEISRDTLRTRNLEYDGGTTTPTHYRKMRKAYSSNDLKSLSILNGRPPSFYRSVSFIPEHIDHIAPPPSTKKEKLKMTRRYFATVVGMCYAIFLVIFGVITFVGDAIIDQSPLPEVSHIISKILLLYMLGISFIYFLFLYIDIRLHVSKAKRALVDREKRLRVFEATLRKASLTYDLNMNGTSQGESNTDDKITVPYNSDLPPLTPISHRYCFVTGRHGEFFYLKLGAAWFVIGLLIDSILQISYQVFYLSSDELRSYDCASGLTLALEILFPIYSVFILFFIYKYINIIINERRGLARLLLMHAIGTSLAYWIYTIVRETTDAIILSEEYNQIEDKPKWIELKVDSTNEKCVENGNLNFIRRTFTPYLYPFVIEFSILIVGIWYTIWAHINSCAKRLSSVNHETESVLPGQEPKSSHGKSSNSAESDHDVELNTNTFIYADCHASHRGLFGGMILMVTTLVFIILFFVAVNDESYLHQGIAVNTIFEISVLCIMIVAVIFAYYQISKLDINPHPISKLDDVLLFIAIPAFFMDTVLSMAPAVYYGSALDISKSATQIVQVLLQTPFIIDGLRRCANARNLRKTKPGRELIMFLTIANVSLWIFYSFSVKGAYTGDFRYDFYGYTAWNILNHISLPLIMFYRFHSSVCLVDIWRHSYEPSESH